MLSMFQTTNHSHMEVSMDMAFFIFVVADVSVFTINLSWVRWRWIASNNNSTVMMQIPPFSRMASFVTEENFCC